MDAMPAASSCHISRTRCGTDAVVWRCHVPSTSERANADGPFVASACADPKFEYPKRSPVPSEYVLTARPNDPPFVMSASACSPSAFASVMSGPSL
ncbi:MAG: hypothetical protein EBR10_05065 [Planctomycetes bacterium]|nr:hypothetical protein [Planctomycetota bacterium]